MTVTIAPTDTQIYTALRSFLLTILVTGNTTPVVRGQVNMVPQPAGTDFVVMTAVLRNRIETNIDSYADIAFTASIAGTTMTVTSVQPKFPGTINVNSTIFGVGLAVPTNVTALGTGTGGVGTYTVSPSQTIASEVMAAGVEFLLQPTEVVIQCDVHGPNSDENAQVMTTLLRDDYAYEFFAQLNLNVVPLYADDPKQVPFINAENQYVTRWIVDVHLQANQVVTAPMQFADQVDVTLIPVDIEYGA